MPIQVRAVVPKPFKSGPIITHLKRGMHDWSALVKKDFQSTTETWSHKPAFHFRVTEVVGAIRGTTSTEDEIYAYVNDGTRPHVIRPRSAKVLAFKGGYVAKTIPGVIGSQSGGASGDTAFANEVQHPGTEARKFDEAIKAQREGDLVRMMNEALQKGAKATGYAR